MAITAPGNDVELDWLKTQIMVKKLVQYSLQILIMEAKNQEDNE